MKPILLLIDLSLALVYPAAAGPMITGRGRHHRVWESVQERNLPNGAVHPRTSRYVEPRTREKGSGTGMVVGKCAAVFICFALTVGVGPGVTLAGSPGEEWEIDRLTHDVRLQPGITELLEDKPEDESETQWLIGKAWEAVADRKYSNAVSVAAGTIGKFESQAAQIQQKLVDAKEPVPIPYLVNTDEKRTNAFARGALNDIAACYIILGESFKAWSEDVARSSEERSASLSLSKQAYRRAERYPHALVWDPGFSGFWSPAYTGHLLWRRACAPKRVNKLQVAATTSSPQSPHPTIEQKP